MFYFKYIPRDIRLKMGEEYFAVNNDAEFESKHPRYPKGTPRGGQFAKFFTEKDELPNIDQVIGLRSAINSQLSINDCEGVLKGRKIHFNYASARFEIKIYGYDDYKICNIMVID